MYNMNWSIDILDALFGGHGRTAILRLLAKQSSSLTGTQIAELTGLSQAGAARALDHFAGLGVIKQRRVGRAVLHELERDNLLVSEIVLPAVQAERTLIDGVREELADVFGPVALSVVLFGSLVRGEAGPGSDIDVLVVAENDAAALRADSIADEIGPKFFRRYGMPLAVIVNTEANLPAEPSAFLVSARDEGVLVFGRSLASVLSHGS
jgi:predicted nucleotidyltransferase